MRMCSVNGMLNVAWSMLASYKLQTCTPNPSGPEHDIKLLTIK